jgi:hypothetical protein
MLVDIDTILHDAGISLGEDADLDGWTGGSVAVVETKGSIEDWKIVASVTH